MALKIVLGRPTKLAPKRKPARSRTKASGTDAAWRIDCRNVQLREPVERRAKSKNSYAREPVRGLSSVAENRRAIIRTFSSACR